MSESSQVPPHNLDAERAVLGAMLLSEEATAAVADQLSSEDFYKPSHAKIFRHIATLFDQRQRCDVLTVAESLTKLGELDAVGGASELISIQAGTPAIGNAGAYAKIVADLAAQRKLIAVGAEIQQLGLTGSEDIESLLTTAKQAVLEISSHSHDNSAKDAPVVLSQTIENMSDAWLVPDGIVGIRTGFEDIDRKLSGLRPGTVTVVGARPAMGKSAFAVNVATSVALDLKLPVVFFTLEMQREEVMSRMIASRSKVRLGAPDDERDPILSNEDWIKIKDATVEIANSQFIIDDDSSVTPVEVLSRCLEAKARFGRLGLIVIDYIQLMTSGRAETRQIEIADISRKTKILAKDLEVPVLLLAQLSRGLESRADHRPMLSDLRESGAIEQDADVVSFLYRDEIYFPDDTEDEGIAEFIVAKHRNGKPGTVRLAFIGQQTRFATLAKET